MKRIISLIARFTIIKSSVQRIEQNNSGMINYSLKINYHKCLIKCVRLEMRQVTTTGSRKCCLSRVANGAVLSLLIYCIFRPFIFFVHLFLFKVSFKTCEITNDDFSRKMYCKLRKTIKQKLFKVQKNETPAFKN